MYANQFHRMMGSFLVPAISGLVLMGCGTPTGQRTLPHEPKGATALRSPAGASDVGAEGGSTKKETDASVNTSGSAADEQSSENPVICDVSAPWPSDVSPSLSADELHRLGQTKIEQKESQHALTILQRVRELAPNDPLPASDLATALLQCGLISEGVAAFEEAALMAPDNPDILANLAQAYQLAGRFRAAQGAYEKAVTLAPNDSSIRNNLAVVLVALGDADEAEVQVRKAISLDSENTAYLVDLGYILVRQKRLQDAKIVLERAVAKDPQSPDAYNMLGFVYFQLKHRDRARENFLRALSLNPAHRAARENLEAMDAEFEIETP